MMLGLLEIEWSLIVCLISFGLLGEFFGCSEFFGLFDFLVGWNFCLMMGFCGV
jgi:hypothetical protein